MCDLDFIIPFLLFFFPFSYKMDVLFSSVGEETDRVNVEEKKKKMQKLNKALEVKAIHELEREQRRLKRKLSKAIIRYYMVTTRKHYVHQFRVIMRKPMRSLYVSPCVFNWTLDEDNETVVSVDGFYTLQHNGCRIGVQWTLDINPAECYCEESADTKLKRAPYIALQNMWHAGGPWTAEELFTQLPLLCMRSHNLVSHPIRW
jgi:hypothetical protein